MKRTLRHILLVVLAACFVEASAQQVHYHSSEHYNKRVKEFAPLLDIDPSTVVMLGNSLTELGGDWGQRLGLNLKVVNRGIIGDNTMGMINRLCQITPHHPQAIVLMAGINDMSHDLTSQQVAERVTALIDSIRIQAPHTRLLVQSILPINESTGRWKKLNGRTNDVPMANILIKAYCESVGITFINVFARLKEKQSNSLRMDLTTDGLHLNEEGYKLWADELSRYAKKMMGTKR